VAHRGLSFRLRLRLEVVHGANRGFTLASFRGSGLRSLAGKKIRATRSVGSLKSNLYFDVRPSRSLAGSQERLHCRIPFIEVLVMSSRKYQRPLPAAGPGCCRKAYADIENEVIDVKDLGSGGIGGVECDHLACPLTRM